MIDDTRSSEPPHWSQNPAGAPQWHHADTPLTRFLGGSPVAVFVRLLFVSLIVGAFLMWLDIRPIDVFQGLTRFVNRIWSLGFDAIRDIADYILAGAVIVIPVWLVLRLLNMRNVR
jgi:hypothetical protein